MSEVLILGAHSDIARAVAAQYASAGRSLALAARDMTRLGPEIADLTIRYGVSVRAVHCDALTVEPSNWLDALGELPATLVCVVGMLGDQPRAEVDPVYARKIIETNFTGPASLVGEVANRMANRGSGTIIVLSSVAGERGRASNYIYGSAKAGLTAWLSGLRNRMARCGVKIVTVKPGFVETAMTAHMKLPALITAQPREVALAVVEAERNHRDVLYVRPIWRWIMLIIRLIPESIFKRLSL